MFGDTLLESSSSPRKGKRWPMATAFTAEALIGGLLVIVPLLSTGVIPMSAAPRPPIILHPVPIESIKPVHAIPDSSHVPADPGPRSTAVVLVSNNPDAIHLRAAVDTTTDQNEVRPPGFERGSGKGLSSFISDGSARPDVKLSGSKRITSRFTEAQLINRVEPVYPRIAAVSGIQGQVKLHAIIARDGSIQSLNAISGHPLLVRAALEAVEQWRYRPYVLNGETVEVETFITVNFRKEEH
jgi:periplasmic protein TonB